MSGVDSAFDLLLEELEGEIDNYGLRAAKASETRQFTEAASLIAYAQQLTDFREQVAVLRKTWLAELSCSSETTETEFPARRNLGRLNAGQRTKEAEYYLPILQILSELGGSSPMEIVLEIVEESMREQLKEVDYQPLNSDPKVPRWRNTAQWARYTMAKEGLLKKDSPRGIWEITEQGIELLAKK